MSPAPPATISALLGVEPEVIAGRAEWWLREAADELHQRAVELGLHETRRVLQLRRHLPAPAPASTSAAITTRPFRRGVDDEAWLAVNAAAFADHPDQGGWTRNDLDARLDADWFDPEGFLVHDGDTDSDLSIDAFCWTKVHSTSTPPMGEIFVIGVHPSAHGRGLGRAMTIAGLADLHDRRGMAVGMLYVESDNHAARSLYESLGFTHHHDDVSYELP